MDRYFCIHGHFYQPPRENAWLESIELQEGADPYHDWNARIDAECYAQNGMSRILDAEGRIARIVNNYERISFDFGPTLLSWLEKEAPGTYERVLRADVESRERFSGHGSALAQAYNHVILPLANARDLCTQVRWGLRDFERRFNRRPEGMWLPETAVDLATLEALADEGLRFTVLAPHQARQVRARGARTWEDVSGGRIDTSRAYEQVLPSGRRIALFFYDGPLSRAVAFERLLDSSEGFVRRLRSGFAAHRDGPELVHIATDGETYGHHHRFGDMALAAALQAIQEDPRAALTNYGEFLERHPPTREVEIAERTAWSCAHGLGRWSEDCGCNTGRRHGWNQAWRAPLRAAFDWLRDELAPRYEQAAAELFHDPWLARDGYVDVVNDRSEENVRAFLARHAPRPLDGDGEVRALKLLELQRHAMLMYTSCGWFFDDLAGIETVQVIQYAGRAAQLAEELFGERVEPHLLELLSAARSNEPARGDGRHIWEERVRPRMLDLARVGAHHAVSALFRPVGRTTRVHCFEVTEEAKETRATGATRLRMGRATVRSTITWESGTVAFAALHLGDHNVSGGLLERPSDGAPREIFAELAEALERADLVELVRRLERRFAGRALSLRSLFSDDRREVLDHLIAATVRAADEEYRRIYQQSAGLMQFLGELGLAVPRALSMAAERTVHRELEGAFRIGAPVDRSRVERLLAEARVRRVPLDREQLEFRFRRYLEHLSERFAARPKDPELLQELESAVGLLPLLPFSVHTWRVQNELYRVRQQHLASQLARVAAGDEGAGDWVRLLHSAGARLGLAVD